MSRLIPPGAGLLSVDPSRLFATALEIPNNWKPVLGANEQCSLRLVTARDTIEKTLTANAGVSLGSLLSLSGGTNYLRQVRVTRYDAFMIASLVIRTGAQTFPEFRLTTPASSLLENDPEAFANTYGDVFCGQWEFGGVLHIVFRFSSNGKLYRNELESKISANALEVGLYAELKQSINAFVNESNYSIEVFSSGPPFSLPANAKLPDILKAMDNFVAAARKNTTVPASHLFGKYEIANPPTHPLTVDLQKFRELHRREANILDLEGEYIRALTSRDEFEKVEERPLRDALETIRLTKNEIDDIRFNIALNPFADYQIPNPTLPDPPILNLYSISAVHRALSERREMIVVMDGDVGSIKKGIPYLIFYRDGIWFAYTEFDDDVDPKTLKQPIKPGRIWIRKEEFLYNNSRRVLSVKENAKGRILFADELISLVNKGSESEELLE